MEIEMKSTRSKLDAEEQEIKNQLDEMYMRVNDALNKSMSSLVDYNVDIATQVVNEDKLINVLQKKIEELSVQIIASQQPVAGDLRKLMTYIYVAMELERIADHASAIAKIVLTLDVIPEKQYLTPISAIAEKCKSMLASAMRSFDEADETLARNISVLDDEIDDAEEEINEFLIQKMCGQPGLKKTCTNLLWITHNLERIGDRTTNIAERVVYLVTNVTPDLNR
jgi:phosphate transport system protein